MRACVRGSHHIHFCIHKNVKHRASGTVLAVIGVYFPHSCAEGFVYISTLVSLFSSPTPYLSHTLKHILSLFLARALSDIDTASNGTQTPKSAVDLEGLAFLQPSDALRPTSVARVAAAKCDEDPVQST